MRPLCSPATLCVQDVIELPCVGQGRYLSIQKKVVYGDSSGPTFCPDSCMLQMAEVQVWGNFV